MLSIGNKIALLFYNLSIKRVKDTFTGTFGALRASFALLPFHQGPVSLSGTQRECVGVRRATVFPVSFRHVCQSTTTRFAAYL